VSIDITMNYYTFFLLCSIAAAHAVSFNESRLATLNPFRGMFPILWKPTSNSDSCSLLCLKSFAQNASEEIKKYLGRSFYAPRALLALNTSCNLYTESKQCLTNCPVDNMTIYAKIFSKSFDTVCSDQFEVVKNDIECVGLSMLSSIECIQNSYYSFSPSIPDSLDGPKVMDGSCMAAGYSKLCYYSKMRENKCKMDAINMVRKADALWMQSYADYLELRGIKIKSMPPGCKWVLKSYLRSWLPKQQ